MDVSVIIPVYNGKATIRRAISSVERAKANYKIEILVIDDGSVDGTYEYLRELELEFSDMIVLKNIRRKGPAGTRNTGLLVAKGQFISFLDADDYWYDDHLTKSIRTMTVNYELDAVINNQDVISETGMPLESWFSSKKTIRVMAKEHLGQETFSLKENIAMYLMEESFFHMQSVVLKKKCIDRVFFDECLMRSEDRDFGIQLSLKNVKFAINLEATGVYLERADGISSSSFENDYLIVKDRIYVLEKYINMSHESVDNRAIERFLCQLHLQMSYLLRKRNFHLDALKACMQSWRYQPRILHISALVKIIISILGHLIVAAGKKRE